MASGANIFAWGANMHMMIMDIMSGISVPQCVEHAVEWCGQARDRQNYVDGMEIFRAMMVRSPPTYASACCVGDGRGGMVGCRLVRGIRMDPSTGGARVHVASGHSA